MAENYSFFNSKNKDRKYNARHWADYFLPLFNSGVFNGDLQVVANGGMSVRINEGYAWIDGYVYHLTEGLVLDLETASGNMNRKDNIVIRLDLTNRWIKGYIVTGSYYSTEATPPAPVTSETIHELVIGRINVPAGTTEITQDMIEDTRMDSDLCGWVCGTVEQIEFDQIKAQFDAFFEKYKAKILEKYKEIEKYEEEQKIDFEEWVESIKDILDDNTAGNLLTLINQNAQVLDSLEKVAFSGSYNDLKDKPDLPTEQTVLSDTLQAGETTVTFTHPAITNDSIIAPATTIYGVSPTAIEYNDETNTLTLTFDKQNVDVGVKVMVS